MRANSCRIAGVAAAFALLIPLGSPQLQVRLVNEGGLSYELYIYRGENLLRGGMRFDNTQSDGSRTVLKAERGNATITRTIRIYYNRAHVSQRIDFTAQSPSFQSIVAEYTPVKRNVSEHFAPRLHDDLKDMIADAYFGVPAIGIRSGNASIALIADIVQLSEERPMPATLTLGAGGSSIGYGFQNAHLLQWGEYRLVEGERRVPQSVEFDFWLVFSDEPLKEFLSRTLWQMHGSHRLRNPMPQTYPLLYYGPPIYKFEDAPAGVTRQPESEFWLPKYWWSKGKIGSPLSPDGTLNFDEYANAMRAVWGMRSWGVDLKQDSWIEHSDQVIALFASAPEKSGAFPTEFRIEGQEWLPASTDIAEYDVAEMAATGYWTLRLLETSMEEDHPSRCALEDRLVRLARLLIAKRVSVGGEAVWFPPGLTRALQPVGRASAARAVWPMRFLNAYAAAGYANGDDARRAVEAIVPAMQQALKGDHFWAVPGVEMDSALARQVAIHGLLETLDNPSLDRLALYQSVWTPPYRSGVNIYGGLPATNRREAQIDARHAETALTFMIAGERSGRKDLFERGVAALRALLGLTATDVGKANGITLYSDLGVGRTAMSGALHGTDKLGEWRGFEYGGGQLLATTYEVNQRYGGLFEHVGADWRVGIDGVWVGPDGLMNIFWGNEAPYTQEFQVEKVYSDGRREEIPTPEPPIAMRAMHVLPADDEGKVRVVAIPAFNALLEQPFEGEFEFGAETQKGEVMPEGFGVTVEPSEFNYVPTRFVGSYRGHELELGPTLLYANPDFDLGLAHRSGWTRHGEVADYPIPTLRHDGGTLLSTADNGSGGQNPSLTGVIASPTFLLTARTVSFELSAKDEDGVYVELVDADSNEAYALTRADTDGGTVTITWDAAPFLARRVRLRLVDESRTGYIEIANFRID